MTTERIDIIVSERGSRVVKRNIDGVGKSGMTAARGIRFLTRALATIGGALAARELIRQADSYTLLINRLKLVTSSTEELAEVNERLFQTARATRTSYQETVGLYFRVARSADELKLSQSDLLSITETVNQAVRVSGATAQEAAAGVRQFGQALGSGVLRGDELVSVLENMPRLAMAIADGLGVTIGELRNLGEDGELTAERVLGALRNQAPQIAQEFQQLAPTVGESFMLMSDAALRLLGRIDQTLGITAALASLMVFFADNLETVAKLAAVVGALLLAAFTVTLIGRVASTIGQVIALQKALGATSVAAALLGGALKIAQRGMMLLNFAMMANPIVFVIGLIAALVTAFFLFRDDISVTADGIVSLGDVFKAVFGFVVEYIGPIVDWFQEAWATGISAIAGTIGKIKEVFGRTFGVVLGLAKNVVNGQIGLWVGAYKTVVRAWQLLPQAFQALGAAAINLLITIVEDGVNAILGAVADLLEFIGGAMELVRRENPFAGVHEKFSVSLDQFRRQGAPAVGETFRQLGGIAADEFSNALSTDYVGAATSAIVERANRLAAQAGEAIEGVFSSVMNRAREIAELRLNTPEIDPNTDPSDIPDIPDLPDSSGSESLSDFLQRQLDLLDEIDGPLKEFQLGIEALDALMQQGALTTQEYADAYRKLRIEFLDTQNDLESGAERAFLKIAEEASNAASQIEDLITGAFSEAEDALVNFVKTGKLDFKSLVDGIIEDLVRLVLRQQIVAPLAQAFGGLFGGGAGGGGGGGGGFLGGLFGFATGGGFNVPIKKFSTGGGFTIPGHDGAVDTVPVSFMASPGERVSITRPGEAERRAQVVNQNVYVNVHGGSAEAEVEESQGADGSRVIDVFLRRSRDATSADIARGGTDLNRAIEQRYGLNPAAGNRT